ncbi:bacitracin ABC transporter ATP-binding protein [uncultured Metabacillus sp.]|nr:bacitracin ABC transporter ATP-binding protein [uncultured Metabacillus sp.]
MSKEKKLLLSDEFLNEVAREINLLYGHPQPIEDHNEAIREDGNEGK